MCKNNFNGAKISYLCVHTFQLWELASGRLKLTLTGHISAVRALAVSSRQPYLFSAGEDKQVKCWDLEYNKVYIRACMLGGGSAVDGLKLWLSGFS